MSGLFSLLLAYCLVKGRNWHQRAAFIYGTMVSTTTFNWPYISMPRVLTIRLRKPMPFTRRF